MFRKISHTSRFPAKSYEILYIVQEYNFQGSSGLELFRKKINNFLNIKAKNLKLCGHMGDLSKNFTKMHQLLA